MEEVFGLDHPWDACGGPAFPAVTGGGDAFKGMTLRDWFAGKALAGLASSPSWNASVSYTVKDAYTLADAMLAERAKKDAAR